MNVLIFTYSVTRSAGGVFDAVRDLFTNAAFDGQDLKVLSYRDEYCDEDVPKWKGLPIELFKGGFLLHSSEAKQAMLSSNANLLHMEALWRAPHLWMSDWKRMHKDKPIVCSPHGMLDPYIIQSQGKLKRTISRLFFQRGLEAVNCYHALCKKELEDIRAYGLKQPVAIIPNGIYLPNTTKHYLKTDDKHHLLYLGRLHKKKGVDILLKAIALVKKESPEVLNSWHIDLVGWDHENSLAELKSIAQEKQLNNIVTFHGGLFGEDKIRMYATSDAYILPSHGEGLPMTVLEAWSWKLPVVMTPQCNLPEGFENGAAIKINDNIQSVKSALINLFNLNDKQRREIGEKGYQLVANNFTWDMSAKKMIHLYNWLLHKADKPEFVYE